jgi:hypothetical protein
VPQRPCQACAAARVGHTSEQDFATAEGLFCAIHIGVAARGCFNQERQRRGGTRWDECRGFGILLSASTPAAP